MSQYLTQESFNSIWKVLSGLYPTANAIQGFMVRALFEQQKVQLQGTGEDMMYSLLSYAEKENRVKDLVQAALGPNEFPNNADLKAILLTLNNDSAYFPDAGPVSFVTPGKADPVNVMLIYDETDERIVDPLRTQLYPLDAFVQSIKVFDMRKDPAVSGGANVRAVIDQKLSETHIALLLLTPVFFSNPANDCVRLALSAFQQRKRVIPVLMEPCMWDRISMLENIVPLPRNREYVSLARNKDQATLCIATEVDIVAHTMKGLPPPPKGRQCP